MIIQTELSLCDVTAKAEMFLDFVTVQFVFGLFPPELYITKLNILIKTVCYLSDVSFHAPFFPPITKTDSSLHRIYVGGCRSHPEPFAGSSQSDAAHRAVSGLDNLQQRVFGLKSLPVWFGKSS